MWVQVVVLMVDGTKRIEEEDQQGRGGRIFRRGKTK
jgi:hypothetical protein